MNELLVMVNDSNFPIDGRQLHAKLGIETPFKKWFDRMCEYGFTAGMDYLTVDKIVRRADGTEMPQTQTDCNLTLSMAKELCMLQRTDQGRQIRRYLIEVEAAWNSPEQIMARALRVANTTIGNLTGQVQALEATIEQDKPFTGFGKAIAANSDAISIGDFAKLACNSGIKIGRTRLFKWLRENKYLQKDNVPYQRHVDTGLFVIKEYSITTIHGDLLKTTTLVTGKGQMVLIDKIRESLAA